MAPLLSFADVEKRHGAGDDGFRLLVPALELAAGEHLVVMGPSGSGKSTMLDLVALAAAPQSGTMLLQAGGARHDLGRLWARGAQARLTRLRARHMGYVLQTGGLLPFLSVEENLRLSRRLLGLPGLGPVPHLAERVGIAGLMRRLPGALSVGQRQRVALVRALAHEPDLVLADEPTAALDPITALDVYDTLVEATTGQGAGLIVVTHDPAIAVRGHPRLVRCVPQADARPPTSLVLPAEA